MEGNVHQRLGLTGRVERAAQLVTDRDDNGLFRSLCLRLPHQMREVLRRRLRSRGVEGVTG